MEYIFKGLDMIFTGIIMYILYPFLPSDIWIISERADQAQDNGIAFFEYLNKEQKNIDSYYLLEKNCKEISSVEKIGKVLIRGTLKHKILFLKSRVVASTEKNIIEPWGSRVFYRIFARLFPRKLKVFLQHGILDKDVSAVYGKMVSDIDIFVTSTDSEKKFVREKFGYSEEQIANVGISRYDNLIKLKNSNKKQNIILYMPTWRRYLFDLANKEEGYLDFAKEEFVKSDYYNKIQELLNDERLNELLLKNNYKFILVTHHGINALSSLFTTQFKNIDIYRSEDVRISNLLAKAKIFITDYSSIHFDSAFLENKNIYYQFDKEKFFKNHAQKSYFSYEKDGFGRVVENIDELLIEIERVINIKDIIEIDYSSRRNNFFKYKEGGNCDRLYRLIKRTI